jgi:PAS domain S-box-containing protein
VEEKALLTYQAMAGSDDIVLVLERDDSLEANDAIIVATNAAFRRASGYSDDQLVGHTVADFFPVPANAETLTTAIRGSGSLRSELACRRADGTTFILGMHLMPAPRRTPVKVCFVMLGRDISEAVKARQMQESIQQLLAKVFGCVDVAVAIINPLGRVVMTNRHCDRLLGYKPNGMLGRSSLELVAPTARDFVASRVKQQRLDGADDTYSTLALREDGSELGVRVSAAIATTGDSKQFRIITLRPEATDKNQLRSESVGRIKLVGIEEVRAALGDRWPAVAERAMATAELVIKRRCGPQDSFSRVDDTSFLMCFGALSEEEASFRAAMIGREIRNRLIGQGESADNAYVRSIAAVVRFPDHGESGASLNAILLNGLDKQLERLERDARETLQDILESPACDLESIYGRSSAQIVASQVHIPHSIERRLASALAVLPQRESDTFDPGELLFGFAAQHAITSLAQGDKTPILVKIDFETFSTRVRTERFFAMCAKIDLRVTRRLIVLLASLPVGLPRTRLQDCINRLRPFCRGVGYQVEELAALEQIDLSNSYDPIVALPSAACFTHKPGKLKEFFHSLQSHRARVLVIGVGSVKDAVALRSVGADMISTRLETAAP